MPEDQTPFLETAHRPWPKPPTPWRLRQRWSRLLFAHWPIPAAQIQSRLPRGLHVDTLENNAWLGVVPFTMDRVRFRTTAQRSLRVPTAHTFPELNLRTYVLGPDGRPGVYFFSLDASSLLAVLGARIAFGLPYFWATMHEHIEGDTIHYQSRRLLTRPATFNASYRTLHQPAPQDDLTHFLTARYALYVRRFGAIQAGQIHHRPWQLQTAEADIRENTLPQSFGLTLPNRPPILHYSHEIEMEAWTLRRIPQAASRLSNINPA